MYTFPASLIDSEKIGSYKKEPSIHAKEKRKLQNALDKIKYRMGKIFELYEEGGIKRRILLAPVSTIQDVCQNPQLQFRNYWTKVPHPELEEALTYCGAPFKLSETPVTYKRPAPLIGEHNEEIYGQELGFSNEKMESLKRNGVI